MIFWAYFFHNQQDSLDKSNPGFMSGLLQNFNRFQAFVKKDTKLLHIQMHYFWLRRTQGRAYGVSPLPRSVKSMVLRGFWGTKECWAPLPRKKKAPLTNSYVRLLMLLGLIWRNSFLHLKDSRLFLTGLLGLYLL